tara:strand:+ start:273 stop:545 length:273 start_codon:yes stop_codon:yes gene_type:complete
MNVYNDVIAVWVNGEFVTNIDDDFIYDYLNEQYPEYVKTDDDEIEYVLMDNLSIDYQAIIKEKNKHIRKLQDRNEALVDNNFYVNKRLGK